MIDFPRISSNFFRISMDFTTYTNSRKNFKKIINHSKKSFSDFFGFPWISIDSSRIFTDFSTYMNSKLKFWKILEIGLKSLNQNRVKYSFTVLFHRYRSIYRSVKFSISTIFREILFYFKPYRESCSIHKKGIIW